VFGGPSKQFASAYAIDVGTSGLRVIRLEPRGTSAAVTFAADHRWDTPAQVESIAFHDKLGEAVTQLLASQQAAPGHAMTCLPAAALRYKNIRLPNLQHLVFHTQR
jgi:Tfp pilus assembly PilM family ATPase